jgi:transposase
VIKKYNSHKELKDTSKGRTTTMTKGRNTTLNERKQIVLYCLENGKNYQKADERPIKSLTNKYTNGIKSMKMVEKKPTAISEGGRRKKFISFLNRR